MSQSLTVKPLGFFKRLFFGLMLLFFLPTPAFPLSPYSTKELEDLEKEFVQLINQSDSVERHPLATQYINHLGQKLAHFARIPLPYFFIVKANDINAFAGPGGYIGINTALILATESEHELAAVMAHEIAHVRLHHLYSRIEHQKQMRIPMLASILASLALGVLNPTLGTGAMMASLTGFAQDSINFTRSNEKEADRIGIAMLIKAGFDPRGMINFFKKMQQNSRYYYSANVPAILRTHPLDEDRIAEAENRSGAAHDKTYADNLNYHLFKELLRVEVAQNPKQLLDYYQHCNQNKSQSNCQFGFVLALLKGDNFTLAKEKLRILLQHDSDNLFYQLAQAEAEIGSKEFKEGIARLKLLKETHPEHYAVIMAYGQGLLQAGFAQQAADVLLKGSRIFKKDLALCEALAQAQAASQQKGYAYFTQAQCQLLQGLKRNAMRQLKIARSLAPKDFYLQARIAAKIEEIKQLSEE